LQHSAGPRPRGSIRFVVVGLVLVVAASVALATVWDDSGPVEELVATLPVAEPPVAPPTPSPQPTPPPQPTPTPLAEPTPVSEADKEQVANTAAQERTSAIPDVVQGQPVVVDPIEIATPRQSLLLPIPIPPPLQHPILTPIPSRRRTRTQPPRPTTKKPHTPTPIPRPRQIPRPHQSQRLSRPKTPLLRLTQLLRLKRTTTRVGRPRRNGKPYDNASPTGTTPSSAPTGCTEVPTNSVKALGTAQPAGPGPSWLALTPPKPRPPTRTRWPCGCMNFAVSAPGPFVAKTCFDPGCRRDSGVASAPRNFTEPSPRPELRNRSKYC